MVFKKSSDRLFGERENPQVGQNAIVIRVQPDEGMTIRFSAKVPGTQMEIRDVNMDFGYGHSSPKSPPKPTSVSSWTFCSASRRCSPATKKSSSPGRSSTPSKSTGKKTALSLNPTSPVRGVRVQHTRCLSVTTALGGARDLAPA